ncbi:MAG: NUDIX hydrolase [Parcubacteria group bacterium]|nr:NUDIX hydrolase [Parcubacteria group bacterium]
MIRNSKLYWQPAITVDIVIFTVENTELKVLLIKRANPPFQNRWALPGGFLLKNETLSKAALRILKEKTGILPLYIEQLYTFGDPKRDPRGHAVSAVYFTLIPKHKLIPSSTLYVVEKLPQLAFDHSKIISYAVKRLRAKLEYTNVAYSLLPKYFTLSELQKSYETILGRKLDKRNFRRKFLSLGLIKPTLKIFVGAKQRPARLYQFISKKPSELKKFF